MEPDEDDGKGQYKVDGSEEEMYAELTLALGALPGEQDGLALGERSRGADGGTSGRDDGGTSQKGGEEDRGVGHHDVEESVGGGGGGGKEGGPNETTPSHKGQKLVAGHFYRKRRLKRRQGASVRGCAGIVGSGVARRWACSAGYIDIEGRSV